MASMTTDSKMFRFHVAHKAQLRCWLIMMSKNNKKDSCGRKEAIERPGGTRIETVRTEGANKFTEGSGLFQNFSTVN